MKDERIQTTANRVAARGFIIWYFLMLISLYYRTLILKQHIRDFWDIFAIFCIGTLFVFIAYANKGVFGHGFKRMWLAICVSVIIGVLAMQFIMGHMHSVVDVGGSLIGVLAGLGLCIGIAHFLNRRWKRKEGLEDEA